MAEEGKNEEKKKEGGGLLGIISLVVQVLTLAAIGFVAWQMFQMQQSSNPGDEAAKAKGEIAIPEAEDDTEENAVIVELNDFTVNLAGPDADRYLKCKISAEVRGEEAKAKVENERNKKVINDLVIEILTRKTLHDLQKPAGKARLKEELLYRLNKALGGNPIRRIFFDEFVIQ